MHTPASSSITGEVMACTRDALSVQRRCLRVASRKRPISNGSIVNALTMRTPRMVSSSSVAISAIRSCERWVVRRSRFPNWTTGTTISGAPMRLTAASSGLT